MATIRGVGKLDHSHPHTHVVAAALRQPLSGKCTMHHHHFSTINPPKQEWGFMTRVGLNLGKTARVISVALPPCWSALCATRLPLSNQQGAALVP